MSSPFSSKDFPARNAPLSSSQSSENLSQYSKASPSPSRRNVQTPPASYRLGRSSPDGSSSSQTAASSNQGSSKLLSVDSLSSQAVTPPVTKNASSPVNVSSWSEKQNDSSSTFIPSSVLVDADNSSVDSFIAKASLENLLIEHSYTLLEKICLRDSRGSLEVKYLKAYNLYGQIVFIEVDCPGYVAAPGQIYRHFSGDNGLPASIKQGTIASVYNYLTGIVFPCSNALVVTTLAGSKNRPVEKNLLLEGQEKMQDCGLYLPYPLIRFSEIQTDSQEILAQTSQASRQIFNLYYQQQEKGLRSLQECSEKICRRLPALQEQIAGFHRQLLDSSRQLVALTQKVSALSEDQYLNYYKEDNPRCIHWNLYKREELSLELLSHLQKINSFASTLRQLEEELQVSEEAFRDKMPEVQRSIPLE